MEFSTHDLQELRARCLRAVLNGHRIAHSSLYVAALERETQVTGKGLRGSPDHLFALVEAVLAKRASGEVTTPVAEPKRAAPVVHIEPSPETVPDLPTDVKSVEPAETPAPAVAEEPVAEPPVESPVLDEPPAQPPVVDEPPHVEVEPADELPPVTQSSGAAETPKVSASKAEPSDKKSRSGKKKR